MSQFPVPVPPAAETQGSAPGQPQIGQGAAEFRLPQACPQGEPAGRTLSASSIVVLTCEYSPFPGGIGTYATRLVGAVREAGVAATVICPLYPELPRPPDEAGTHRILKHHHIGPIAALRVLRILRRAPESSVLLAADIRSALVLYLLRRLHGRAYRVMVHGSEASKFRAGSLSFKIARRAYMTADSVLFNSRATRSIFEESVGSPRRGTITYLGVDAAWFAARTGGFENGGLGLLPQDANIICSVGRIEARKGQLETVRAIARARDVYGLSRAIYVIAGRPEDADYSARVVEEARRLEVPVLVPGPLSDGDLKRLTRRAVCHSLLAQALPGKIEGFGLVLLEAAAQACPSVATTVGGIPEVLGSTGVLVAPDDIDGAARAFAHYAGSPRLRSLEGEKARERAQMFTWSLCAARSFPELDIPQAKPCAEGWRDTGACASEVFPDDILDEGRAGIIDPGVHVQRRYAP